MSAKPGRFRAVGMARVVRHLYGGAVVAWLVLALVGCGSNNYLLPSAAKRLPNGMAGYQQAVERQSRDITAELNVAIRNEETVVATDPGYAGGYMRLASLFIEGGQPHSALSALRIACRLAPKNGSDWVTLGQAEARYGSLAAAQSAYQQALRLNPGNWMAWDGTGFLAVSRSHYADAWKDGETALEAGGVQGPTEDLMGRVLYGQGDPSGALQYYAKAQAVEPNWWQSYYDAARASMALGDQHGAEISLGRALQLDPGSGAVWQLKRNLSRAERNVDGTSNTSHPAS